MTRHLNHSATRSISKKTWLKELMTPQALAFVLTAAAGAVSFVVKTNNMMQKESQLETVVATLKMTIEDLNNSFAGKIDEIKDWTEYEKGYQQAIKDFKNEK